MTVLLKKCTEQGAESNTGKKSLQIKSQAEINEL